ncbi:MAG: sugar ABC transporter substrate-binding protein [Oscillospiraceae bacterium]|nr:sugar ABC transporter substrate-binding protein [Oscillospiraceae bacterium]
MKTKSILSALLAGALTLTMTACSSSGSSTGTTTTKSADTQATDTGATTATGDESTATSEDSLTPSGSSDALEVLIWDTNQQPGIQEILDEFTEKTGIKTDLQVKSWDSYWTLLEAAAQAGGLPDVMWMHSNVSQMYMKNGLLLKLDDYIADSTEIDLSNYMSEITDLYTYDGATYGIPKDYDTIALWYNKTMFDAAGLSYPDATWTWDDLYENAKKLTKSDGSQYGFTLSPSNNQAGYYNVIYSMGGKVLSDDKKTSAYDDPTTIEAMELVGKIVADTCPDVTTMSETGDDVLFESGTVAMTTQGSWMVPAFKSNEYVAENCDVAVLPYAASTKTRASICNGLGWTASATSERPDDCWTLLEWLGSKDMQLKQAELGVTMSAYLNTSDAWAQNTDLFNLQAYLDVTTEQTGDATNELILRPYTYKTTVWEDAANQAFVSAWTDTSQMESVCKSVAQEMNTAISQENS